MSITTPVIKLACVGALLAAASALHAQTNYHVSFDTSTLETSSAAPFYVDFQLIDGTGTGNGNTSVLLSNFSFGGGSPVGPAFDTGDVSGALNSSIELTDTSFFNEAYQQFTPGAALQFDVQINSTPQSGPIPDSFAFTILDNTLSNLPTLSDGSDVFALVNVGDGAPEVETFASDVSMSPAAGGPGLSISAPLVQPVPEPSTYGFMAAAGLTVLALAKRRRPRA